MHTMTALQKWDSFWGTCIYGICVYIFGVKRNTLKYEIIININPYCVAYDLKKVIITDNYAHFTMAECIMIS